MLTYHIRSGVRPRGMRVTDRGAAGRTLCGAAITDHDATLPDARRIVARGWVDPTRARCIGCFNRLLEMDFARSAHVED